MEDKKTTNLKKVGFDAVRYLVSLFFLYLIFLRLNLSWEVIFFIILATWLQFSKLEIPCFGGQVYHWFLWSLLFSSNLSNAVVTFFISFFFQKGLNVKEWRHHFDRFVNVLLPFSFFGFFYLYFSTFLTFLPFRFFLFLLFSQFFWGLWYFLDSLGENLVFKPTHTMKNLFYSSMAGAGLTSLFAITTYLIGVGGALASLLLSSLADSVYSEIKEKEGVFDRNLQLISAIEKKLLHQPEQTKKVISEVLNLGESLHLAPKELADLKKAALFHNVGMLKAASFINREGLLDEKEFDKLKEHTKVLEVSKESPEWLEYVWYHHEHFDGTGYPEGVIGESIPLPARILTLAQAFVALTSARPYRQAFFEDEALEELKRGEGTKYDAVLLRAYVRAKKGKENVEKEL